MKKEKIFCEYCKKEVLPIKKSGGVIIAYVIWCVLSIITYLLFGIVWADLISTVAFIVPFVFCLVYKYTDRCPICNQKQYIRALLRTDREKSNIKASSESSMS